MFKRFFMPTDEISYKTVFPSPLILNMKKIFPFTGLLLLLSATIISCNDAGSVAGVKADSASIAPLDSLTQWDSALAPKATSEIKLILKPDSQTDKSLNPKTADSAFIIASEIFNTPAFQQTIRQLNFKYSSYCRDRTNCKRNEKDRSERITGQTVLDDLFKEKAPAITFHLLKEGGALGSTCPGEYDMTAYYNNIMTDMDDDPFPPAYKIAVNVCHEYMHQVGYCHIYNRLNEPNGKPDSRYINDDVTYRVGWEAYYLVKKWFEDKKVIKGLP